MKSGQGIVTKPDVLPAGQMRRVQEVVVEQGHDLRPLCQSNGIPLSVLDGGANEIASDRYYQLLRAAIDAFQIPAFGFKVGQKFCVTDYGVLGYAFMSSPTVGYALDLCIRYQRLLGAGSCFTESLRVEGDTAVIAVKPVSGRGTELARFEAEESLGQYSVATTLRPRNGPQIFRRVHFTFSRPDYAEIFTQALDCPVLFDQEANEFFFPSSRLDDPLETANEVAAEICEKQCEVILGSFQGSGSLAEQVKRLIVNKAGAIADPKEIANRLHISYRTLRRRLREEGTTFKRIRDEVLIDMAMEYLGRSDLTIQEIAFLLDYSEASNFHRTFKGITGLTPLEYRNSTRVTT